MYLHRDNPLFSELKTVFAWIDMGRGNLLCGNQRCPLSWIMMDLVRYGICKVGFTHEMVLQNQLVPMLLGMGLGVPHTLSLILHHACT